jgi:hypothetical protein
MNYINTDGTDRETKPTWVMCVIAAFHANTENVSMSIPEITLDIVKHKDLIQATRANVYEAITRLMKMRAVKRIMRGQYVYTAYGRKLFRQTMRTSTKEVVARKTDSKALV